ncbi:DUF1697 domain-containing protein [Maribacter litopenaei]|uniref:DUF1697 domain-containing protein n=1 Tax=Maribacter litopenaei TaxID=2976127 RepID=A0ABY5Y6F9_9FLAO|nr:DUF1697 domain-containing protein [Maribacter litopenaei]UWX54627.1 DUF1697 domain-containing protein [Maribacter litopenaei]
MNRYVAFLRGINVSGQRKVPMAELRSLLSSNGFSEVKTYIQSGNVVFEEADVSAKELKLSLEEIVKAHFGFDVPVLVKSVKDLNKIVNQNPFTNQEDLESNRIYFIMLFGKPKQERVDSFRLEEYPNEEWELVDDCLYLCCKNGYGNAKLNNNLVERKLKLEATTRNHRTLMKLLEMGSTN